MNSFTLGDTIYHNALATESDVACFRLEGEAHISFPKGRLRMENLRDPAEGQKSNFVLWCPETFPADVSIEWEFWPVQEPGLCILFFAATGREGKELFDPSLAVRTGGIQAVPSWRYQRIACLLFSPALAGGARLPHL